MKSFLQGKKTLSIASLRPIVAGVQPASSSPTPVARPTSAAHANHGQPTVEVVKEGDKVVRLIVVCGCGERIEIECLYPAGG
ncbi:hypothetical protein [Opitutus terrae]|uniref:Uncharacterized protein n=1 Tax=Opitutus terrae (strain DSM 11246 / JCM 15787 / PB90-1) TaxID=452637 RepID=B1ZR22_OPITP|nr:hypothetical protein [Opitutus terrae]ACB73689.1 hypothetical protein Oter_0399 [Opitutus terrae PB90-1]